MTSDSIREERLRLQRLLLPETLPSIGCTEAAAAYRPHNHEFSVGGDWFDLVDRPDSQSVVAIVGDVVGHGVEQISVMGQLRAASNALAHSIEEPHEILSGLDRFAQSLPGAHFATLAVVVFDGTTTARICSAGHPPPIHLDQAGEVHVIEHGRRPPLTMGGLEVTDTFTLEIGDLVIIYTDGVVERRGEVLDQGISALGEFVKPIAHLPCSQIVREIVDTFGAGAEDDQAVLVVRPLHQRGDTYELSKSTQSTVSWPEHSY